VKHYHSIDEVTLSGLTPRAAQCWRGVRLVPLVRTKAVPHLRIARVRTDEELTITRLSAHTAHPERELAFVSIVPHAFVVGWGEDAEAEVNQGVAFVRERDGHRFHTGGCSIAVKLRMARRASDKSLRFVPQQLAVEGLLSLFFAGPDVASRDWSERLLRRGLDPRVERAVSGRSMEHLADALRVFEILEDQCGMLLFFKDVLFGSFVAPTHEDYRAVHDSLVLDLFPAELLEYAAYDAPVFKTTVNSQGVRTIADLRAALAAQERAWAEWYSHMASGLIRDAMISGVYSMDGYRLERFVTTLARKGEHHAGERIVARDGTLAYLKSYRLGAQQARRAYLLKQLGANGWDLERAAVDSRLTELQFVDELRRAGFEWMLGSKVLDQIRRGALK
jgi:hypothetical protein